MKTQLLPAVCLLLLLLLAAPAQEPTPPAPKPGEPRFSTVEEIKAEFDKVPCSDSQRLRAVKALFEKMGASPAEVMIEKFKGVENVVVHKVAADTTEKVVIGAHYDVWELGCGAVDNWTGIVALAHIYRTLKDVPLKKTVIFVAFGKEERGLVGSRAMVAALKPEQVGEYCAMINIDSLGLTAPQVLDNMSSKKLADATESLAKMMSMPFARGRVEGASSDSVSFLSRKIPAVTISALPDDWRKVLHTVNDQAKRVKPESVYLGYRLTLSLLVRVAEAACGEFRESQ